MIGRDGGQCASIFSVVIRGLEPRIHQSSQCVFLKKMDGRVKPGHDGLCFAKMADEMLALIHAFDKSFELRYNKHYIGLMRNSQPMNFAIFR
jgi:hypothetical protein